MLFFSLVVVLNLTQIQ